MPFRVNAFRGAFRNPFGFQNVWSISFRDYPFRGTSPLPPPPPLLRHRPSAATFHQKINKTLRPCGHGGTSALKCGETLSGAFREPFGNPLRQVEYFCCLGHPSCPSQFGQANPLPDPPAAPSGPPAPLAQPGHPPDSSGQPVSSTQARDP